MASLDRLVIQGIRSFGPEERDLQRMKFYSPLTLILGQNGCGKTTIIESLKYALTGDVPPGAKQGQLFVHDPKISRKIETHARIQLRFKDLKGDHVLVTRLMQLTQKARKLEFKTRDSSISRKNSCGKHVDISGRCVDIDVEVCTALGVSKSILNSVIFCHQEESAWPLDEGKRVKEKFDDIFDATKHNKYLEHIRQKKKNIADDVKLLINSIGYLKTIKDEVGLKKKQLNDAITRVQVSRDQIDKHNSKLQPITDRLKIIYEREGDINKLYTEKEKKKTELKGLEAGQHELRQQIQSEFKGSTYELEERIKSFCIEMKRRESHRNELTSKLSRIEKEDKKLQSDITQEEVKKGQYQRDIEQQQERVDSRNKRLNRLAEDLEISEKMSSTMSYTQLSEDEVTVLLNKVNKKMKDSEADIETLRIKIDEGEQELQNKIDRYRDKKVSLEHELNMKTNQIRATKDDIRKTKEDIEEVDLTASKLVRVEAKLERAVQDLEQVEKSVNIGELREEIKQNIEKRNRLEKQLDVVDKEVKLLQQQSSVQAELDIQRESKSLKQTEIRKLKNRNEDTLKHLLKTIPEQGIKYELKLCIEQLGQDIKEINVNLSTKLRDLTTLETNRKHQKEMLRKYEEDLRAKEDMIYEACGNQDYDDVVKRFQSTVQDLQDQKGTLSSSEYMFRRYIQKLQQPEPCCPLCHRGFDLEADVRELVSELNSKVREVPSCLRENSKKLDSEQKKYEKLVQLKPTYESVMTLKNTEIPNLRAELEQTEKKLQDLRNEVENLESQLLEPQTDKEMAEKVQPDVVLLDQNYIELQKLQRDIERLEAKLPAGRSSRSMQQALNEQEETKLEVNASRRMVESTQQKLTRHTDRLQELREEKNRLTEERFKIEGGMRQRKQLEEKQLELQGLEALLNEEVDRLRENLGMAKKDLDVATKEKSTRVLQNKKMITEQQSKFSEYQKRVDETHRYQSNIKDFEKRDIEKKLTSVEQKLRDLETIKDTTAKSIQDINTEISMMNNEIAKQQMRKRDLDDNLKLRSKEAEAEILRRTIEELISNLGDLKHDTLLTEKRKLLKEEEAINKVRDQVEGMMKEQQTTIATLREELRKPIYKNAEKEYIEKVIKKKVEEKTVNDLDCYYQATEWAMFHFHKEKMEEINTVIRELWRQIYRGNDIDYIEIKTDVPEHSSSDKRRNYNYRVVQMKNDVEIDMRGRCSAGQKVLAALIIRMALAETFSASCGMLALDEPTTNLDRENIESLSTALADIVNTRVHQKNFQLIIITHDEEFLDRLSKVEKLEVYYRVSRNEQGKSLIVKHSVDR